MDHTKFDYKRCLSNLKFVDSSIFPNLLLTRLSAFVTRFVEIARDHEVTEEILDLDDRGRSHLRTKHRRMPEAR